MSSVKNPANFGYQIVVVGVTALLPFFCESYSVLPKLIIFSLQVFTKFDSVVLGFCGKKFCKFISQVAFLGI